MTKVQWRVAFKGQQFAIGDCSLASLRALAKGVREGGYNDTSTAYKIDILAQWI
jgi:hypothetical protein